jgi:transposase-like protein
LSGHVLNQGGEERSVVYSQSLKQKLIQQMLTPGGRNAASLARETGIGESTLHRWRLNAARLGDVSKRQKPPANPLRSPEPRRPDERSADEKLRLVLEASALGEAGLGEFLRRHGLHEDDLAAWRQAALSGLSGSSTKPAQSGDARRVRELEKELRRKDAALAETAALLVLKKKVQAIWGDEDDDTNPRRDE